MDRSARDSGLRPSRGPGTGDMSAGPVYPPAVVLGLPCRRRAAVEGGRTRHRRSGAPKSTLVTVGAASPRPILGPTPATAP
jgi:hypothetical protein